MYSHNPMRLIRAIFITVPVLVLTACGSGDGQERIEASSPPPPPALTGQLFDSPVAGVDWQTSSGLSGVTNLDGEFEYQQYDTVTFSIGGITLGSAPGARYITPVELTASGNAGDQAVINQLVFLQSIDEDGDPDVGGIRISEETSAAAVDETLNFNLSSAQFATAVADVVAAIAGPGAEVVSETDALDHFYASYAGLGGTDTFDFEFPDQYEKVGEFVLLFQDEFNTGTAPNPEIWNYDLGYGPNNFGWGNNEWQLYTDDPENIRVENGNLIITALCPTAPCGKRDGTITSARITTTDKFEFRYGKIVARILVPTGQGTWPAFWSLGANFPEIGWPRSGEIDFMEVFNNTYNSASAAQTAQRTTTSAMHWCDENIAGTDVSVNCFSAGGRIFVADELTLPRPLDENYQLWEANWTPQGVTVAINGEEYFDLAINPATMEEFREEFFLLLNIAVGGTLGSGGQDPEGDEQFPQSMMVDYVRVFQRAEGYGIEDTLIDFEDDADSYEFANFAGGNATVIPNPQQNGINTSDQVAQMVKAGGEVFGGAELALAAPAEITAGGEVTAKVWSQRQTDVTLKLELPGQTTGEPELEVSHSGSGWEELSFDFSSFTGVVEGVTVIFDIDTVGQGGTDWTFYYDDILLPTAEVPPAPAAYAENFEGLDPTGATALGDIGWTIFGAVFDSLDNFKFGYGAFPAPNNPTPPGWAALVTDQGGPDQGGVQLSIFSDYNCCQPGQGHFNGTDKVESNVFQERTIGAFGSGFPSVGTEVTFSFDAKRGNIEGTTTAIGFLKTIDPNNNFAQTNFEIVDTTDLPETWARYEVTLDLSDPLLEGQLLQFGFSTTTSDFAGSGVFYDNLDVAAAPVAP